MATFARELKQAWRSLIERKAYFFTCAATLALVLGANAAMFAVVNATMLRPMPFATSGEVVHLFGQPPARHPSRSAIRSSKWKWHSCASALALWRAWRAST